MICDKCNGIGIFNGLNCPDCLGIGIKPVVSISPDMLKRLNETIDFYLKMYGENNGKNDISN
jgi:DnaJ-class molecular chaperone